MGHMRPGHPGARTDHPATPDHTARSRQRRTPRSYLPFSPYLALSLSGSGAPLGRLPKSFASRSTTRHPRLYTPNPPNALELYKENAGTITTNYASPLPNSSNASAVHRKRRCYTNKLHFATWTQRLRLIWDSSGHLSAFQSPRPFINRRATMSPVQRDTYTNSSRGWVRCFVRVILCHKHRQWGVGTPLISDTSPVRGR